VNALSDLAHGLPAEGLVPGDADGVAALSHALAGYADLLADAGRALGRVEVSWDGSAAGRFRDEFGLQPGRFSAAAGCFEAASTALGRYAAALASAQLAADRARDLYAEGVRAAIAAGGGPLGVDAGPLDVLVSPAGCEQRLAAVELLERVRADVDRAGNETAECLRGAMASAPEPVSAWQHAWNFLLAPPWDLNQERRDWAAGAAVGILDTLVLASNPLPLALWVGASTKPQVNAFEWRLGADPRSGFHTAGAVVVPAVLTGWSGLDGVVSRSAQAVGLDSLAAKPANPVPEFLFRSGSRSATNFTPRPDVDVSGLSTFDSLDNRMFGPGRPVQVIRTSLLKDLQAVRDGPGGHHSIRPDDDAILAEWAASRGSDTVHPLTQELLETIVETVRKPKR
jgi:hypothetical protein